MTNPKPRVTLHDIPLPLIVSAAQKLGALVMTALTNDDDNDDGDDDRTFVAGRTGDQVRVFSGAERDKLLSALRNGDSDTIAEMLNGVRPRRVPLDDFGAGVECGEVKDGDSFVRLIPVLIEAETAEQADRLASQMASEGNLHLHTHGVDGRVVARGRFATALRVEGAQGLTEQDFVSSALEALEDSDEAGESPDLIRRAQEAARTRAET